MDYPEVNGNGSFIKDLGVFGAVGGKIPGIIGCIQHWVGQVCPSAPVLSENQRNFEPEFI